jgi:sulfite oxidase
VPPQQGVPFSAVVLDGLQLKANWQAVPALQAMPVQSAFLQPKPGETLKPDATGCITAAGYAWSGGGSSIIRVEVSADAGKTWVSAQLQNPGGVQQPEGRAWAWVFWEARVPVEGLAAKVVALGQGMNAVLGAGVRGDDSSSGIANDGEQELGVSTNKDLSSAAAGNSNSTSIWV